MSKIQIVFEPKFRQVLGEQPARYGSKGIRIFPSGSYQLGTGVRTTGLAYPLEPGIWSAEEFGNVLSGSFEQVPQFFVRFHQPFEYWSSEDPTEATGTFGETFQVAAPPRIQAGARSRMPFCANRSTS